MSADRIAALTPREREILTMIADGDSLAGIAQKLSRSLKTVESHRLSIGRKLKASNRVQLAKIAIAAGMVSIDKEAWSKDDTLPIHTTPKQELEWLTDISEAVCNVTGQCYIDELVKAVTKTLGVRYSGVCISPPDEGENKRYIVSVSERGERVPSVYYDLSATPVKQVIHDGRLCIPDGLSERFPHDRFITINGMRGYLGLRLDEEYGADRAVLAIIDDKPIKDPLAFERVLRFFLARTCAELERVNKAKLIQQLRTALSSQSSTTPTPSDTSSPPEDNEDEYDCSRLSLTLGYLSGAEYLSELTDALCKMLGVRYAGVSIKDTEDSDSGLLNLSVSERGRQADDDLRRLVRVPCEKTFAIGYDYIESGAAEQHHDLPMLKSLGVAAYCGFRLDGQHSKRFGVIWVMDDKPFAQRDRIERVLRFVSTFCGCQVEQVATIEHLRQMRDRIESELPTQDQDVVALRAQRSQADT